MRSGGRSPRSALKRRISASPLPTRIRLGGRSRISPNCRFQQISSRSLSNTAMPWRTWSSAVCRTSRLYWMAALASSSSFKRRLGRHRALAQQQRQHQARRGGADGGGEDMLGIAHQAEIGFLLRLEADALAGGEAFEGRARALFAEIARHRRGQLLHRHRGAPQPEARRHRRQLRRHEQIGLQPLDRRRLAAQREADKAQDVDDQAEQHAVHQRRKARARTDAAAAAARCPRARR